MNDIRVTAPLTVETVPEPPTKPRADFSHWASIASLVGAVLLWVAALPAVNPDDLNDYGLVAILPWTFWASLGILSFGLFLTLNRENSARALPALYVTALVVILHATPAIVYETLRYSWAWKHLGIVDFIQRHGGVDRNAAFLPAYHNWPGLFVVTALIGNALHLDSLDLSRIVRFAPVVLTLGFVAALTYILRRFTTDRRLVLAAVWIFVVGNWVGQDYFSPQGTAFLFYLVVLGLVLGPLRTSPSIANFRLPRPLARFHQIFFQLPGAQHEPRPVIRMLLAGTAVALIVIITATHQLTPVALILALGVLALTLQSSLGLLVFAIVAEVCWLLYFASPFVVSRLAEELGTFGEGLAAAQDNLIDTRVVSAGMYWVVIADRILTGAIALIAVLGGLRRLLMGYRDGTAVILTLAAFPLLANTYGGEILFRVYLFALPFLAFFAAALFFPAPGKGGGKFPRAIFAMFAFAGAFGFIFSNNGKDRQYRFSEDEVAAAEFIYRNAPPGSLLIEGSRNYPSQFINYENFSYLPLSEERPATRAEIVADPESIFARWMTDKRWKAAYVIITSSQKAFSDAEGVMPPGALASIEQRLMASPRFIVVAASPRATVFMLHPSVGAAGKWADELRTPPASGE